MNDAERDMWHQKVEALVARQQQLRGALARSRERSARMFQAWQTTEAARLRETRRANDVEKVAARAMRENWDLRMWKDDYMKVESTWNEQEVGQELGMTLGTSIREQLLPKIRELKFSLAAARRQLERLGW